jgi:hypothetical protein
MAITTTVSQKELQRVAEQCYEGKYARVSLALLANEGYTTESTVLDWDSIKISGNGYTDFRAQIATGAYDTGDARYEMPEIVAEFTATGTGYVFNTVYVVLGTPDTFTISDTELTDNVATITTTAEHGFTAGRTVIISGATNAVFNGTYVITGTPSVTTFTYAKTNANVSSAASSGSAIQITEEANLHSIITELPAVVLSPAQTVTYKIQFCTDD